MAHINIEFIDLFIILLNYFLTEVMNLDWNDTSNISNEINPDIIFGSDIIYDPTIIEPLCDVLNTFCNRNENAQVFIAGVIRNEETLNMFLKRLGNYHSCVSNVYPVKL